MMSLRCNTPDNNAADIAKLVDELHNREKDGYWIISDADIVPEFQGDYSGSGQEERRRPCYELRYKLEKEKRVKLRYSEFIEVLQDTRTVYRAVMVYFRNCFCIENERFYPTVEYCEKDAISHKEALYEIRIMDGDMFIIFDEI